LDKSRSAAPGSQGAKSEFIEWEEISMAACVVLNIDVTDPVRYPDYARAAEAAVTQYGGRYLARGGRAEGLEGLIEPKRIVILEFPSYEQAKAWWDSAEYHDPKLLRQATAQSDAILVAGV
jgi:uncharacterized protein (DUF1330 family)